MMKSSSTIGRDIVIAIGGALSALAWRELFEWWSQGPALTIYEQVIRRFDLNDIGLVMGTDVLFALGCGLLFAALFIRIVRPAGYRPELVVVVAFLVSVLLAAQLGGEGAHFLLRVPPLWVTLLCFGIRVGYGIKAERKRIASSV